MKLEHLKVLKDLVTRELASLKETGMDKTERNDDVLGILVKIDVMIEVKEWEKEQYKKYNISLKENNGAY